MTAVNKVVLVCAIPVILFGCSKQDGTEVIANEPSHAKQTVKISVASFDEDRDTRTAVSPEGNFLWSSGDKIGIYPLSVAETQESQQIIFKVVAGADASSAEFTGTGWGLIVNGDYSYFSYYPYSVETTHDTASVIFADNLNQTTNTSTAHLGVNDFLYAPAITPTSIESAALTFYHLSALVEFKIKIPEDARTKSFTHVVVSAKDELFTVSGTYNPSITSASSKPTISIGDVSNRICLKFNDKTGFQPDSDGFVHAYFLIAPAKVAGKQLSVKLYDSEKVKYVGTVIPKTNIESQNHKRYSCSVSEAETMDLSAHGTANCYVISEEGMYKLRANVKGNGYDPLDPTNHNANASIDLANATVEVLWETVNTAENTRKTEVGDILSNVVLDGQYVSFYATGVNGNALISVKDSNGSIMWSWHVWVTDTDLDSHKQLYGMSCMMDRNLGALSGSVNNWLSNGFYYQWGRPTPYLGIASATAMYTTNNEMWGKTEKTQETGNIDFAIQNPMTFIYSADSGNWSNEDIEYWGEIKTMYDPSPVGWKVPKGGNDGIWETGGFTFASTVWVTEDYFSGRCLQNDASVYYPAFGFIYADVGLLHYQSNGNYWGCTSNTNDKNRCNGLGFGADYCGTSYHCKGYGYYVRCSEDSGYIGTGTDFDPEMEE